MQQALHRHSRYERLCRRFFAHRPDAGVRFSALLSAIEQKYHFVQLLKSHKIEI